MKNNIIDEYRTRDLGEAAALLCSSVELLRLERKQSFCWFIFSDVQLCKKLSNQYFFGDLKVKARDYQEATGRLKNRIFATGG